MNPPDLDLPPKFARFRRYQEEAVIAAACSDERFTVMAAPPGVGKSAVYMMVARLVGGRGMVLTHTKELARQLMGDFSSMGLVEMKGQNNYPCLYFEEDAGEMVRLNPGGWTPHSVPGCDEGPCHAGIECVFRGGGCHYYDAVRRLSRAALGVTNYRYWMTVHRHAEPLTLGRFDFLVLDEAHEAAAELADFATIRLDRKDVSTLLSLSLPARMTMEDWVEWADTEALPACRRRLEGAKTSASLYRHGVGVVRRLRSLEDNLVSLSRARSWRRTDSPDPPAWVPGSSTDWVAEKGSHGVVFQPVWAGGYAEGYLFADIPRVLLVSATITRRDARYLGIPDGGYRFLEYPSPFKRSSRPFIVVPCARVGRGMSVGEKRIWLRTIDQIIELELYNGKGVLHAVSYDRARMIKDSSRFGRYMLIHDRGSTRTTIDRFKSMSAPAILVSPSVGTGVDFAYDLLRWQILAKIPFIDSRPAVIAARARTDKSYLDHVASVAIMQMAGRGTRSEDDWSRTYLTDDNWSWFWARNKSMFPRYFRQAVIRLRSASGLEQVIRAA